ncbi:MAG: ABC transporter substrate-binding protein [Nocardiopsaceae bacterium]|nr:ABC transporter substrate-binding protein [Nocardiopsaceae bacterium]
MASVAAVMIATAVTACSTAASGENGKAPGPGSANINLAIVPSVNNVPAYIAQYDGFFAQQGLHVNIQSIPSSAVVIADELKGKVDVCAGAYLPFMADEAAGQKFRILDEGSVMGTQDRVLMTPKGSPITRVSQLAGKTIGLEATNSIGTLLVDEVLEANNVSPSSVHYETNPGGFQTMATQLNAGAFDAAFFGEPFATEAQEKYSDTVLANLGVGEAAQLPMTGYIATRKWADGHPAEVAAFNRAIQEAQRVATANPQALRKAIARSDHLSPVVADVIALPGFVVGRVDAKSLQRAANAMLQFGQLSGKYSTVVKNGSLIRSMIQP